MRRKFQFHKQLNDYRAPKMVMAKKRNAIWMCLTCPILLQRVPDIAIEVVVAAEKQSAAL